MEIFIQNNASKKEVASNAFAIAVSTLVICYFVVRAFTIPLTYDEAWTWHQVVTASYAGIVSYKEFLIANNHVFNSLWVKWCFSNFGYHVFCFRIISVLGGFVYVLFSNLIIKKIDNLLVRLIAISILLFQPCLLDYFSLARGYGLAIGLLTASVYYVFEFFKNEEYLNLSLASVLALLATISNFSLVYPLAAIVGINVLVKLFYDRYKYGTKINYDTRKILRLLVEVGVLIVLILYVYPVGKLLTKETYLLGSDAGLVKGTFLSLLYLMAYNAVSGPLSIVFKLVYVCNLLAILPALYLIIKRCIDFDLAAKFALCLSYLFIVLLLIIAQYALNGIKLPVERGVLYLVILFNFLIIFSGLIIDNKFTYLANGCLASLFLCLFLLSMNAKHTFTWNQQIHDKEIVQLLDKEIRKNNYKEEVILATDDGSFSLEFYIQAKGLGGVKVVHFSQKSGIPANFKHFYFYRHDGITKPSGRLIATYADINSALTEVKQ